MPMAPSSLGPALVLAGVVLLILGALVWTGGLSWFGRLPGDIRVERESVRFYFPIVSSLLISLVLTLVLLVLRRFR
ncbi:MAG TPA: DUF2905 domain-containing protein [Gemmatimonadales bacterium]|nr:DUF2905 domain-containing protein [Gemmatimonadales bacterium]